MVLRDAVAVSAPGKVLLAGGYLVLDRAYTGLVFGLDARIHVLVQPISTTKGVTLNEIEVTSPQFDGAVWEYGYRLVGKGGGMSITQLRADADLGLNRNAFIETALGYALSYIAAVSSPQITPAAITILADNDYYSAPGVTSNDMANGTGGEKARFRNFGVPISKAHKTGLGSSAALVTSFIGAVLSYYLPRDLFDLSTHSSRQRLHNLAQAAHCAAQGKVGSGFDVASAVYGSCVYRRFSPSILASSADPGSENFAAALKVLVEDGSVGGDGATTWDTEVRRDAVKIPKGLRLVMCDVSCGSQTVGMVKTILAWRKAKPEEADPIWTELHEANESLAMEMKALAEQQQFGLERLRQCFARIRRGIRLMSEQSGVPVEPPAQTKLLDACEAIPGVIGGVVPGAGGYDAISLLIEDKDETISALQRLLAGWHFESEDGSIASGGRVSMLSVREEMEGVRAEKWTDYDAWASLQ